MNKIPVAVTGLGVITSNSKNTSEFFDHCMHGQLGIKDSACPVFDTKNLRTQYWGFIDNIDEWNTESSDCLLYRNRILAKKALDEALSDAGLSKSYLSSLGNRGVVSIGSLSYDDYYMLEALKGFILSGKSEKLSYLRQLSDLAVYIKQYCGIQGACYNFSSACAAGAAAVGIAMNLIQSGQSDVAVVCGVDPLSLLVAYGFHSLKALSPGLCSPLNEDRNGINIGEGCGVLILESLTHAQKRQADIYAQCIGYSIGNEAYHITAPDTTGEGFYRSMHNALNDACLTPDQLDYINLHGTGTFANDSIELTALTKLYENVHKKPYVSTLKTLIGHCMGAAGVLEAILTILCLKHQCYFPAFRMVHPMKEVAEFTFQKKPVKYALSNSFAFAGNTASIVFAKDNIKNDRRSVCKNDTVYITGIGILLPMIENVTMLKNILGFGEEIFSLPIPQSDCITVQTPTHGISARKLRGVNHLSRMVLSTALQAEADAGLDHTQWIAEKAGTVYTSSYGTITDRIDFGKNVIMGNPDSCNPTTFSNISPNAPLGHLCICMNCKGSSTSMHGASALPISKLLVQNGSCHYLLSCSAEEYNELLAATFRAEDSYYRHPYQESAFHLLLQNTNSGSAYCSIGEMVSCSIGADPLINPVCTTKEERELLHERLKEIYQQLKTSPDVIFIMGLSTSFDHLEENVLKECFPTHRIVSASHLLGGMQHNTMYANLAIAAVCLKEGVLSDTLVHENDKNTIRISTALVTGYDSCGNYHCVMLHK